METPDQNPFPQIEVLPKPIERVIEIAQRIGHFLNPFKEVPPHMSDHYVKEHFEGQ
jgi:hypothetical protein